MIDVISYYRNLFKQCDYKYLILYCFDYELIYNYECAYREDRALSVYKNLLNSGYNCVFIEL